MIKALKELQLMKGVTVHSGYKPIRNAGLKKKGTGDIFT